MTFKPTLWDRIVHGRSDVRRVRCIGGDELLNSDELNKRKGHTASPSPLANLQSAISRRIYHIFPHMPQSLEKSISLLRYATTAWEIMKRYY